MPTIPLPLKGWGLATCFLFLLITLAAYFSRLQDLLWDLIFNHVTSPCTALRQTFQEGAQQ